MRRYTALLGAATLAALSFLGAPSASADTFNGAIFIPNAALSGFPTPFATVVITTPTLNSSTATVTYTALTQGADVYSMGGVEAVGFNAHVTGTSVTAAFTSGTCQFAVCGPLTFAGVGNQASGEIGTYNLSFDSFDGYTNTWHSIILTLTNVGGTWANAADVKAFNNIGSWAEAHIFACVNSASNNCSSPTSSAIATGFAGGAATGVPEPGTLALLGTGLVLVGTLARRFKK